MSVFVMHLFLRLPNDQLADVQPHDPRLGMDIYTDVLTQEHNAGRLVQFDSNSGDHLSVLPTIVGLYGNPLVELIGTYDETEYGDLRTTHSEDIVGLRIALDNHINRILADPQPLIAAVSPDLKPKDIHIMWERHNGKGYKGYGDIDHQVEALQNANALSRAIDVFQSLGFLKANLCELTLAAEEGNAFVDVMCHP